MIWRQSPQICSRMLCAFLLLSPYVGNSAATEVARHSRIALLGAALRRTPEIVTPVSGVFNILGSEYCADNPSTPSGGSSIGSIGPSTQDSLMCCLDRLPHRWAGRFFWSGLSDCQHPHPSQSHFETLRDVYLYVNGLPKLSHAHRFQYLLKFENFNIDRGSVKQCLREGSAEGLLDSRDRDPYAASS